MSRTNVSMSYTHHCCYWWFNGSVCTPNRVV